MSLVTSSLVIRIDRLRSADRQTDIAARDGDEVPFAALVVAEPFATELRIVGHQVQNN
jgi:hypothetical protein